ncbi:MAG: hypothetical protein M3680_30900, partial [Myxococcota bacterium]|nr:hypothetical protein [Myxococcota bacterium]
MRTVVLGLLILAACGGSGRAPVHGAAAPPPAEHWATVLDQRFVAPAPCGTGPFEVVFPARSIEFGRRLVVQVYGARKVALDNRLESDRTQWAFSWGTDEGDHTRCRVGAGEGASAPGLPLRPVPSPGPRTRKQRPAPPALDPARPTDQEKAWTPPVEALPALVAFTGELPGEPLQVSAAAFYPLGEPFYYADEYRTPGSTHGGTAETRLRFWFAQPSDLEGVVFRFLDQELVPDQPLERYRREFAVRVSDTLARRTAAYDAGRAAAQRTEA